MGAFRYLIPYVVDQCLLQEVYGHSFNGHFASTYLAPSTVQGTREKK